MEVFRLDTFSVIPKFVENVGIHPGQCYTDLSAGQIDLEERYYPSTGTVEGKGGTIRARVSH